MRASVDSDLVSMAPGGSAEIGLDIVNTSEVIDGVTARVLGLADQHVSSRPAVLPLFPDSAGRMTLKVAVPTGYPAGRHPLTVELRSRQADVVPTYLDFDLQVARSAGIGLSADPEVVRTRRTARYAIAVTNLGNVGLDVAISVSDPERAVSVRVEPATLTVPPAGAVDVLVLAKGPRMILGMEIDRPITVTAVARPLDQPHPGAGDTADPATVPARVPGPGPGLRPVPGPQADPASDRPDGLPGPEAEPLTATTSLTLRQRPWLTRGLLTALILLAIIAGWAAVFLFGLGQVFGSDPLPKNAPPSYYAAPAVSAADADTTGSAGDPADAGGVRPAGDIAPDDAAGPNGSAAGADGGATGPAPDKAGVPAAPAPANALSKSGALPAGAGGAISGTVTAESDGAPAGRITVEALRRDADGELVVAGSAASQADGSYEIAGLFPTTYYVRLSADGYHTAFAPAAADIDGADGIAVAAGEVSAGTDAVIAGFPATISGSIDPGDTTAKVEATVRATPVGASVADGPAATVTTNADGEYEFTDLPAPGSYDLVFETPGYLTSTVRARLDGGARRLQPTVVLRAAEGSITGIVTSGGDPVGKATVGVTVGGKEITTGTPTSGRTGEFVIGNLPTPATYVITVTAEGYAPGGKVVDLKPGQKLTDQTISLVQGTGQVTGRLTDPSGEGLGGATVTVGGGVDLPGTSTLTSGTVGAFSLENLPSPGSYTLTFALAGYADQTVPLVLTEDGQPDPLQVTMSSALGSITGQVTDDAGAPVAGAAVVATNGVKTWPVTTTASAGVVPAGGYVITGLTAGTYTVTATGTDGAGRTALVTVTGGDAATQDFGLGEAG